MTITKMYQIIMMFLLTYKRSLAQSANSQQPTANSQQPTANSQQVIFTVIILYFVIYILRTRAVSDFFPSALFLCLFGSSTTLTDRKAKGDPETSSG